MRSQGVLMAAVAALCALSVSALNSYCKDEPRGPFIVQEPFDIQMSCGRKPNAADIWLQGNRTQFLNIHCMAPNKDFTCEDMPELDFGRNSTIMELNFMYCPLSFVSIACAERHMEAREVLKLTVELPLGSQRVLREDAERLQGAPWISMKGQVDKDLTITRDALTALSALEKLELSWMRLHLAPGALAVLRALTHLKLRYVYQKTNVLEPGVISNLPSLTHLSLFATEIENITKYTFQNLTSLEVLDVSSNELSSLDAAALATGCPRLRELHARWNPLVNLRHLEPLQHLEKLDISTTRFTHLKLSPRTLAALPRLAHVKMAECRLHELPADLLAGSKSLLTLDLSKNLLSALPTSLFAEQRMLQNLDLSYNELKTLPQELFSGVAGLQRLNLYGNLIVELPDQFIERLAVRTMNLGDNPLRCDCHLHHLAVRMRQSTDNATLPRIEVEEAKCDSPASLSDRFLNNVALHELVCDMPAKLDELTPKP